MLLLSPIFYYEKIRERFANSYLAEDTTQTIVGIDCEYISSEQTDFAGLKSYFKAQKFDAPFAGLFGVLGYGGIKYFEKIPEFNASQYDFPDFFYANARAYLHFDKNSKIYSFYGNRERYYDFLVKFSTDDEAAVQEQRTKRQSKYKILTDLDGEKEHFLKIAERAKEYLKSGDVFQVVLSEQLKLASDMDSLDFYRALSEANPSPYMFHFPTPYGDVAGSSPELVCEIKEGKIYVAPIAGTRGRGKDAIEDAALERELLSDEKELAEHKMLIDLARNDIGRVSKPKSVAVKNAMRIVRYESVMHIVSDVYGAKADDLDAFDAVGSIFPAGTLSGTPKIRAMEIIAELESYKRNAYGGGIGFFHFNGDAQMAILIRSAIFARKFSGKFDASGHDPHLDGANESNLKSGELGGNFAEIFVQAGAGIVIDSVPEYEYKEICKKRASVLNVFAKNAKEI